MRAAPPIHPPSTHPALTQQHSNLTAPPPTHLPNTHPPKSSSHTPRGPLGDCVWCVRVCACCGCVHACPNVGGCFCVLYVVCVVRDPSQLHTRAKGPKSIIATHRVRPHSERSRRQFLSPFAPHTQKSCNLRGPRGNPRGGTDQGSSFPHFQTFNISTFHQSPVRDGTDQGSSFQHFLTFNISTFARPNLQHFNFQHFNISHTTRIRQHFNLEINIRH